MLSIKLKYYLPILTHTDLIVKNSFCFSIVSQTLNKLSRVVYNVILSLESNTDHGCYIKKTKFLSLSVMFGILIILMVIVTNEEVENELNYNTVMKNI